MKRGCSMKDKVKVLGDYFFDSIFSDIDSLAIYGGIHAKFYGYYRMLSKRFPYAAYYSIQERDIIVVHRVLDLRQDPKKTRIALQ